MVPDRTLSAILPAAVACAIHLFSTPEKACGSYACPDCPGRCRVCPQYEKIGYNRTWLDG